MMDVEEFVHPYEVGLLKRVYFDAYEIGVATIKEGAPIVMGVLEGFPHHNRWASMAKKHNWIDTHN